MRLEHKHVSAALGRIDFTLRVEGEESAVQLDGTGEWVDPTTLPEWDQAAYDAASAPAVPVRVTRRQGILEARSRGWITDDEAWDWLRSVDLPAAVLATIDQMLTDPDERFEARADAIGADRWERSHFLVAALAAHAGHADDVDDFFREATKR